MLIGNVDVALAADDADITIARGNCNRSFAGKGNVEILRDPMIPRALIVRVQSDHATADANLRLGAGVPLVGFVLVLGADALMHDHANQVILGGTDVHRAARIGNAQAGSGREGLTKLVVKVKFRSEDGEVVAVVDVNLISEFSPIDVGSLSRNQSANDDANDQENSSGAEPRSPSAFPLGLLIFNQLN